MTAVTVAASQLLLGYLPPDRGEREGVLQQKRAAYQQFKEELIIDPKKEDGCKQEDHPLSQSNDSRWNAFFKVPASHIPSASACGDDSLYRWWMLVEAEHGGEACMCCLRTLR